MKLGAVSHRDAAGNWLEVCCMVIKLSSPLMDMLLLICAVLRICTHGFVQDSIHPIQARDGKETIFKLGHFSNPRLASSIGAGLCPLILAELLIRGDSRGILRVATESPA